MSNLCTGRIRPNSKLEQQPWIFRALMLLTTSQICDMQGASMWVMYPNVQFVNDIKPLANTDLFCVRVVPGVALCPISEQPLSTSCSSRH